MLFLTGCPADSLSKANKKFGNDTDYFIGLKKLQDNQEQQARAYFIKCRRKGSYYCARRSAEILTTIGDYSQRAKACRYLLQKFPDSDSLLICAKEFYSVKDYEEVINLTEQIDFSNESNELILLRLHSLQATASPNLNKEVFLWFTKKPVSETHYQFFRDEYTLNEEERQTNEYNTIRFLINVYKRDYKSASSQIDNLKEFLKTTRQDFLPLIASSIGKTFLYSDVNYIKNAEKAFNLAQEFKQTPAEFYFWFYAGRLYDKAEFYKNQSADCFENAIRTAPSPSAVDNALWYLLTSKLSYAVDSIIANLDKYARLWSDAEYFDDFFESLISTLLISGKWNSLYTVYTKIDGYASDETVAKFAYVYARLLQEGYATSNDLQNNIKAAFERTCQSGTNQYYKIMAAYHLNLSAKETLEILKDPPAIRKAYATSHTNHSDTAAENLLKGYAYFGFPEKIYPEWLKLYKDKISYETSMYLSKFLQRCGDDDNSYYSQSLRIASRAANLSEQRLSSDDLKAVYPQNFKDYVDKSSSLYGVSPEILYALIRSESFFDPNIISSAGAVGLTQLMEFTGSDIARKLKMQEYSLTDAETNIKFGSLYLSELIRRCNNSILTAFFSYNAGISRVRRWQQTTIKEFGKKQNMPGDLFLETIPFAETREYGRKLVSASVIYKLLYEQDLSDSTLFAQTVQKLVY